MAAQTLQSDPDTRVVPDPVQVESPGSERAHQQLRVLTATPAGHPAWAQRRAAAIEAWLPLAQQLARRYGGRGEPLDDIIQTASVGLIKAIDRFEPGRGSEFVAFAVPTILGEIRRHFRDRTWDLRVPRRLQELRLAIRISADNLTQELGHSPTTEEVAADLQMSPREVAEGMGAGRAYSTLSLNACVPTDGEPDTALGELLGEEDTDLAFVELRMTLGPALAKLPEREQRILRLRFYGNLTQTEIAQRIGVSQMHVSRLLSRSLGMLRDAITDGPDPGPVE